MRQIFISNVAVAAAAAAASPEALAPGQVGVFAGGASIDADAGLTAGAKIRIAQGVAAGEAPKVSGLIEVDKIHSITRKPATGSDAKVVTIGNNGVALNTDDVVAAAGRYEIKIVDRSLGTEPYRTFNIEFTATGSSTPEQIVDGLVAHAKSVKGLPVTLAKVASDTPGDFGITVTGAAPTLEPQEGTYFDVILTNFGDTAVATANPVLGIGEGVDVAYLERTSLASEGFLYRNEGDFRAFSDGRLVANPALDYDIVTLLVETNTTENIAKANKYVEYVIAVNSVADDGEVLFTL